METKRVALYARVSTINGQNPEMQLAEMREYASRRGWNVFSEYVDRGVSGATQSRRELSRLMVDACRRRFDLLLCWKVDRFGRSLKHLVDSIADLDSYGMAFVSLRDNLDLSTPSGRLMMQIVGAMAEFERSLIQERVISGLRNAKLKGKRLGRPPLRVLNSKDVAALRRERLRTKAMFRNLANKYGVSVFTAYTLCAIRKWVLRRYENLLLYSPFQAVTNRSTCSFLPGNDRF